MTLKSFSFYGTVGNHVTETKGAQFGLDDAQLDALFIAAAQIKA